MTIRCLSRAEARERRIDAVSAGSARRDINHRKEKGCVSGIFIGMLLVVGQEPSSRKDARKPLIKRGLERRHFRAELSAASLKLYNLKMVFRAIIISALNSARPH
jgi:hypothetical protein